jgi:hypothetical protein
LSWLLSRAIIEGNDRLEIETPPVGNRRRPLLGSSLNHLFVRVRRRK